MATSAILLVSRTTASAARRRRLIVSVLWATLAVGGCAKDGDVVKQLTKALETQAYDELARVYSQYCASLHDKGLFVAHTRIEMAREIRQSHRAQYGPLPPGRHVGSFTRPDTDEAIPDGNTRMGRGPIVMIYCEGDEVPDDVWRNLDRYWKD